MSIRVLVNGAFGRMGQMVVSHIGKYPQFVLAGQTGREYDLQSAIRDSHALVVVDFTSPESVYQNALDILEAEAYPVIGTTGLTMDQIKHLQSVAKEKKLGGVIAPNFSIAAILMMQCAQKISKFISEVEIIELHHADKKDSPSGTALRTAELIAEARTEKKKIQSPLHQVVEGARGANYHDVNIHSVRLPGFLAHQMVLFGNAGETLSLRHDTLDRSAFMHGVFLACEKAPKLTELVYGLENVM